MSQKSHQHDANGRVTEWDFYGGSLAGIEEKLSYLENLGITALYLNPIYAAHDDEFRQFRKCDSHRNDTLHACHDGFVQDNA